jgi:hypothetical protein
VLSLRYCYRGMVRRTRDLALVRLTICTSRMTDTVFNAPRQQTAEVDPSHQLTLGRRDIAGYERGADDRIFSILDDLLGNLFRLHHLKNIISHQIGL